MLIDERQQEIMSFLRENKSVNVKTLAQKLYVSEATVRRDLTKMQKIGLLERSHGGAILPESAEEVSIFVRMNKNAKEKEKAVVNALGALPPFKTVFIDSSSTALALAQKMDLAFKTVVTNNLQTALRLSQKPNVNLLILGGNVQSNNNSTTGSWTARQIEDFSFDLCICSCAAASETACFERSIEQREIKSVAMKHSKNNILIADHTKWEQTATYKIADLSQFDFVVTDIPLPFKNADVNFVY